MYNSDDNANSVYFCFACPAIARSTDFSRPVVYDFDLFYNNSVLFYQPLLFDELLYFNCKMIKTC